MTIAQAAGVGGGSLAYSNVALEAHPSLFTNGWPTEITYDELKPCYDRVSEMMSLQTVPDGQLTQRFKLAREAAETLGHRDRFSKAPLAVSFSPDWNYQLNDPFNPRHSRTFTNAHGQQQGTCIHLGNCDIGCDVRAKNTLDLNYIARAEQRGAEVRPLHLVRLIEPRDTGYRVVFDRIHDSRLIRGEESAARVFLAAGSLGSTELLLRSRDEHRTLPTISRMLGQNWSANANVLSMATYADASRVQQTIGPSISGVLDFMDGSSNGQRFVIEDDGFPNLLLNSLRACLDGRAGTDLGRSVLEQIEKHVRGDERSRNVMVWLGAGMDAADGRLSLKRAPLARKTRALESPMETGTVPIHGRGDPGGAPEHDEGDRGPSDAEPGLEPLQEPGDPPPARRVQDGRHLQNRSRRSPRTGLWLSEPLRRRRLDSAHLGWPQPVAHDCRPGRAHGGSHQLNRECSARSETNHPCHNLGPRLVDP